MPLHLFDSKKTLKPLHAHKKGKAVALHRFAVQTLGSGDMRAAVRLPTGEDECEWIAMHCVDFYNEVSLLYGTISEFCTREACPTMSAGSSEYLWADGVAITKPMKVSAPEYVDLLLAWIEGQLGDDTLFVQSSDAPFPRHFKAACKKIFTRLFRVYAHIYCNHIDKIAALEAEAHLNTAFKHFVFFVHEFGLVDAKEMAPLDDLIFSLSGGAIGARAAGGGGGAGAK